MTLVDRMRWLEAVRETMPEDCTAFLVAFHLQAHDGKKGIYPPIALLAEEVRRDERNVRRALGRLKKAGLLSWSKGFPGKANYYYLKTPKRAPVPGKTGHMHAYAQGASAQPSQTENSGGRGSTEVAPPPKEPEKAAPNYVSKEEYVAALRRMQERLRADD